MLLTERRIRPLYFIFLCIFYSCGTKQPGSVEYALEQAGGNKPELEKVLKYYADPADSLKLKAARFLIVNMPDHYGNYSDAIKKYTRVFSIIDTVSYFQNTVSVADKIKIADSIAKISPVSLTDESKVSDCKKITAQYLINNIEFAFKAWKNAPWKKQVSFNDFCEYVLPYRIRNEQVEVWRPLFYNTYNQASKSYSSKNMKLVFDKLRYYTEGETNLSAEFNSHYPLNQNLSDIMKGRVGACETVCFYAVNAMRAAGLPVALDYIPHWGNYNSNNHHISHLIDHPKKAALLTNDNNNVYLNTWGIVDFSSDFDNNRHKFTYADMPRGLYIQNIKTIPKVYRHSYAVDPELQEINHTVPPAFVAPLFKDGFLKDVTDEYIKSGFIHLDVAPRFVKNQLAYLCVFDISGWQAVAASRIVNNAAAFNKIGTNIMYLPAVYEKGIYTPIGAPFCIDSLNSIRWKSRSGMRQKINLARKFALYSYTAYHTEVLKGGRFEASNSRDFSKADLLYQIDKYPFYLNEAIINIPKSYRYFRYVAPIGGRIENDNIAEVQFYAKNEDLPLQGRYIGMEGQKDHEIAKAFDSKIDTYYQSAVQGDGWIGIDLGERNRKQIAKIKFCPRNDTNCIMPENEYELFYWDDKWVSLGTKTAKDYNLIYNNAPENCLFWLRCNTGGQEERIFTIEGGRQIWW